MQPVGDLLGDQGGVAAGAVVDNEVHPDLVFYGLVHDLYGILDHLRIQHAADHFVKREGFGIGLLIAHPKGSDKTDDCLLSRVTSYGPWQTASGAAAAMSSGKRPIPPHAF